MTTCTVDPRELHPGRLVPPPSKSDAQRALVIAHALGHPEIAVFADVGDEALPRDVRVLARGLERIRSRGDDGVEIDCADGGAPFRFLLTQAAIALGARVRFTGSPRLGERPHRALLDALREALGPTGLVLREGTPWPLEVVAPRATGEPRFRVAGVESSQFASSLLLGAAVLERRERRPWTVQLVGPVASAGYLELTVAWLERCGFRLMRSHGSVTVEGWSEPPTFPIVPGDWSSLGYLLLMAWRAGATVGAVDLDALHPDRAIVGIVESIGLRVESGEKGVRVTGTPTRGIRVDGSECPDLVPTLAALACVLPEPSQFDDVGILRAKESDRLEGIMSLVRAIGGTTTLDDAGRLEVRPPPVLPERFVVDSRGDHRLAMAAATLAVLTGARAQIGDPACVAKSFPGFWTQLASIGVRVM